MVEKTWRKHTRTTALVTALEQKGSAMAIFELIEKAQELHPLSDPWNYRDFLLRKKEIFTVKKVQGTENVGLTRWLGGPDPDPASDLEEKDPVKTDEIPIICLDPKKFIAQTTPPFVDVHQTMALAEAHLASGMPLLEEGPKGIGKTLGFAYFAFIRQMPCFQFDCCRETKRQDLIGRFIIIGDQIKFVLGALPAAIELANEHGEALFSLEEFTSLDPDKQKILNQFLDQRKHVYVPELARTFKLNPGARLLIVATANPSFYGGVFEMNEDLKSRFSILKVGYPPEEKEREIIRLRGDIPDDLMDMILVFTRDTRAGAKSNKCQYAISPRDIHQFLDNMRSYGKVFDGEGALKMALTTSFLGKYDDEEEIDFIKARIFDAFAVRL